MALAYEQSPMTEGGACRFLGEGCVKLLSSILFENNNQIKSYVKY
jgi:hypothetical protein